MEEAAKRINGKRGEDKAEISKEELRENIEAKKIVQEIMERKKRRKEKKENRRVQIQ